MPHRGLISRNLAAAIIAVSALIDQASAQSLSPPQPPNNCSGASSSEIFRACLAITNHSKPTNWRASHPTIAQPKPPNGGPGFGQQPGRILPAPMVQKNGPG